MSAEEQQPTASENRTSALMEISNAMVQLYKQQFGRGLTSARTLGRSRRPGVRPRGHAHPGRANLVEMGEHQRLRDIRMFFQYATVRGFCDPVEDITGRTVRSFHSSIDTKVDGMAVETFILYPEGHEGPSRTELEQP